jgi:hypothetical protein
LAVEPTPTPVEPPAPVEEPEPPPPPVVEPPPAPPPEASAEPIVGPAIKPLVIGQDEIPVTERKRGWWKK